MHASVSPPDSSPAAPSGAAGLALSGAFWLSLFAAAGLFAASILAPKFVGCRRDELELRRQVGLVTGLAIEVERLDKVRHALETDPDYLAALARQRLKIASPDATSLEVTPLPAADDTGSPGRDPASLQSYPRWMERLAQDALLRSRLLTIAAGMVLFAFTFLHERNADHKPA